MSGGPEVGTEVEAVARQHLRWGWTMLALFAALGMALEGLHGFKIGWYLDVGNEARRLMFRLGHAHGTLIGLLNLGLAFSVSRLPSLTDARRRWASRGMRIASVLMPGGFLGGGLVVYEGDPGLAVVLVPIGAAALVMALALLALGAREPDGQG